MINSRNSAYLARINNRAVELGLKLETNDPGDGLRIRIFQFDDPSDFFGPNRPLTTIFHGAHKNRETIALAEAWLDGYGEQQKAGPPPR